MKAIFSKRGALTAMLSSALILVGCGGAAEQGDLPEGTGEELGESESALHRARLPFTPFTDPQGIGRAADVETRLVLTSQSSYQATFGHRAPAHVDFANGDAVVFYSAGVKRTGGYKASIHTLERSSLGYFVYLTTRLESPGPNCVVTMALSKPYVLAKFKLPARARYLRSDRNDLTRDCSPVSACAAVLCGPGTHCEEQQVECIRAPCEPQAVCVRNVTCGGIANIKCPGAGTCSDDPTDSCDPARGGRDCSGVCACNALGTCVTGYKWDSSPGVCGCVPTVSVKCGNTTCAAGMVCCNASCGICTPPGGSCIQLACT